MRPPGLLVVGHVTEDWVHVPGHPPARRLGGAASFCSQVARRKGEDVAVVTSAPERFDLLDELRSWGVPLHLVASAEPTTFRLEYGQAGRRLHLLARAAPLEGRHVPPEWRQAPVSFLGPVANEVGPELAEGLAGFVGLGLQGAMRGVDSHGRVGPSWPSAWLDRWPAAVKVAAFSDEDVPDAADLAAAICARGAVVALAHGARGATLMRHAEGRTHRLHVAAHPAREVDPTGAGDTFAVVLTLALGRGLGLEAAGAAAAEAAARVTEGPGLGSL